MNKVIIKRMTFLIMLMISFFVFIPIQQVTAEDARDLSSSSSWQGEDMTFEALNDVDYMSPYVTFETIIDHPEFIDVNKIYVIEKATDLYNLSRLSKEADKLSYLSLHYILGNDIDYYEAILENVEYRFYPIGFDEPFNGIFDGQGFEITNLYFHTILDEETYDLYYQGLRYFSMFSKIGVDGEIKNFGLINPIMIQPIEWGLLSYASFMAGENYGSISHVYVIDERLDASGMHIDGAFHLSGLVSLNHGTFKDSFISSPYVRSRAVSHALSVSPVIYQNEGVTERIYYDKTIYSDTYQDIMLQGLATHQFQDDLLFSSSWFFNNSYVSLATNEEEITQVTLDDIYPSLHGLTVQSYELIINSAVDMLIMQELLNKNGFFRKSTYVIDVDIDMASIAHDAYQANNVSFDGTLKGNPIDPTKTLYTHQSIDGGAYGYYTLFNLNLENPTETYNYATWGIFSVLFGRVENLNFRNVHLIVDHSLQSFDEIKAGIIAGEMISGTIQNVHIDGQIHLSENTKELSQLNLGGFIGVAEGVINDVSFNGEILGESILGLDQFTLNSGTLVGTAINCTMESVISEGILHVIHSSSELSANLSYGGLIGSGENILSSQVIFSGEIVDSNITYHQEELYVSGLYGILTGEVVLNQNYQNGSITYTNLSQNTWISGIASLENASLTASKITHSGLIQMSFVSHLVEDNRYLQTIKVTQGFYASDVTSQIKGLFNESSIELDMAYIDQFAHLYINDGIHDANLFHADNQGHITAHTSTLLTHSNIKLSSMTLGSLISLSYARNEGNINVSVTEGLSLTYPTSELVMTGIMENLSDQHELKDIYQGGHITLDKTGLFSFDSRIIVSGVLINHENDAFSIERNIDPLSIDFDSINGPMHNILQSGDLLVSGSLQGDISVSSMVYRQKGMMTQAINLGDVSINNYDDINSKTASGSGITNFLIGKYASIFDSVNSGNIKVNQMSPNAYAHASGIANRNDLNWDLLLSSPADQHHLSKIAFTMNYGDIYAWGESLEEGYAITQETKTKAAAILTMGILSLVNNVNYGNVYGKYLASGMIGFLPLNHFGTLAANQVFISNLIQYGRVRAIQSFDWVESHYMINSDQIPARTAYNAYGAIVGKIHTGTSTWAFAGDVTYPIDRIYFGYLINIDEKISMFSNAPELSSSWADGFGNLQEANDVILNMLAYMGTTNPNDQSKAPFTYFFQGGWIGQYMGKVIDDYTLTEDEGGLFNEAYAFRSERPIYKGTDQYIHNFIAYIDKDHANPEIMASLENQYQVSLPGIYALSSSEGIGQGIFMPDNMDVSLLHPYDDVLESYDLSWMGTLEDESSIAHELYVELRQIQASFAATIYDLEIVQMDEQGNKIVDGMSLSSPVIDENRNLITYYLPSNAEILNQTTSSLMDVYRFIEVSDGLGRKVPDIVTSGEQTYSWIGDYKKVNENFVEIGPYHTTGTVMLSTSDAQPIESYSRNNPVYNQTMMDQATINQIFKHQTHTYILFFWYATGYRITPQTGLVPGYGAYAPYTLSGYPTLYQYVGPSLEPVTYIKTDVIEDVIVFDDTDIYFGVDVSSNQNEISHGATLSFEGSSQTTSASVPRSYGIYEAMYDASGLYIDSIVDHYGSVRVYSMSYDPLDPASYQDYEIRIIRTADQAITDLESLTIDDVNALPKIYDFNAVTATQSVSPIDQYQKRTLSVLYQTMNLPDLQSIIPYVKLKDSITGLDVDPEFYDLDQGMVETLQSFNNATGSFGEGHFTLDLHLYEALPSGTYYLTITLMTGDIYIISFDKLPSNFAKVTSITYQGVTHEVATDSLTSTIPYGIFYDANISETKIVNFSNLSSLMSIDYLDVYDLYPSYLDAIELSTFSKIDSIELVIDMVDTVRHRYQIIYHLVAEDLTTSTFTHILLEASPVDVPEAIYVNGSVLDTLSIDIGYNDAPTIHMQYDLDLTFVHTNSPWIITSSFTPYHQGEDATLGLDYVIQSLPQTGYDVDFLKDTPIGTYETTLYYDQQVVLWDTVLTWEYTYQTITYHKLLNDQSMLEDIYFVSDAVFQGFNTIIDDAFITIETYEYLLMHPVERDIVQLPTTGIMYQDQANLPYYYVIGQVQQTQLAYYSPTFIIPDGATIKRVINTTEVDPSYQSDLLYADFSPISSDFQYIQYRIYAMDYDIHPTHYTDYYIAVQDMTNMIRFDVTIENQAAIPLDQIYLKISICHTGDENISYPIGSEILTMGMFSNFINDTYEHSVLQTTTYGAYKVDVDLPFGYAYTISVSEVVVIGNAFYVENSIFPRKVYMTLTITDDLTPLPWGNHQNEHVLP
jgi:hypothetical protein